MSGGGAKPWDPHSLPTLSSASGSLDPATMRRLRLELRELLANPLPGIVVVPDDVSVVKLHALITGPEGTPYANGFFVFVLGIPADYPASPPKVRLMTTGGGAVRFGPNLYSEGKVCLSILGTWAGPPWTPACSISSVLLSIQSLMNEQPYKNEPGLEMEADSAKMDAYNAIIAHETLRVAVIDNVQRVDAMPSALREAMLAAFCALDEEYAEACRKGAARDGGTFRDPLSPNTGRFAFGALAKRISDLHAEYCTAAVAGVAADGEL